MHFQVDAPDPIACEECGVQGEFVRVTLWVVRRRYTCRACKTTFRPQLPEMVDGFRMTLRLHEYVEKESFTPPLHLRGGTDRPGREDSTRHLQRPRRVPGALAPLRDAPHFGHRRAVPQQALPLHPDQHRGANPARSTTGSIYQPSEVGGVKMPHQPLNPYTRNEETGTEAGFFTLTASELNR